MDDEVLFDASGLLCPLPIIEAARVLRGMPAGGYLRVLSTDAAFASDFRAFCEAAGHELLAVESLGRSQWVGRLRKGGAR
jgi:tRNA 2-thiouridine synthesizing protein A